MGSRVRTGSTELVYDILRTPRSTLDAGAGVRVEILFTGAGPDPRHDGGTSAIPKITADTVRDAFVAVTSDT